MIMSQQVLLGCRAFSAVAIRLQRDCVVVVDATLSLRGHLQKIEHRRICGGDSISADVTTPIDGAPEAAANATMQLSMTQLRAVNGWLLHNVFIATVKSAAYKPAYLHGARPGQTPVPFANFIKRLVFSGASHLIKLGNSIIFYQYFARFFVIRKSATWRPPGCHGGQIGTGKTTIYKIGNKNSVFVETCKIMVFACAENRTRASHAQKCCCFSLTVPWGRPGQQGLGPWWIQVQFQPHRGWLLAAFCFVRTIKSPRRRNALRVRMRYCSLPQIHYAAYIPGRWAAAALPK